MLLIDRDRSRTLAGRMYVDPGDEDFGQCCFNARRALFRLHRLGQERPVYYTEGYTVYLSYNAPLPYPCVAAHAWVTTGQRVIDVDYAAQFRFEAAYFPGRQWPVDRVYQRLKAGQSRAAFEFLPTGIEMTQAYVNACEYRLATWPQDVTPADRDHLSQWQRHLEHLTQR